MGWDYLFPENIYFVKTSSVRKDRNCEAEEFNIWWRDRVGSVLILRPSCATQAGLKDEQGRGFSWISTEQMVLDNHAYLARRL